MPDNLICPKCGAVYPWQKPRDKCRYCKTRFTRGTCAICHEYSDKVNRGYCTKCKAKSDIAYLRRNKAKATEEYLDWLNTISQVPAPLRTLTEEDWDYACRYFGGCAICGKPEIEARVYYVPRGLGGSYTMYNIVPVCEKCAMTYNQVLRDATVSNPFKAVYGQYHAENRHRVDKVKSFLKERYEEYVRQAKSV